MAMKTFFVGVKAVIQTEQGILLIKHSSGFWDLPGGRIDDEETFEQTLRREISEELPGAELQSIGKLLGPVRVHKNIIEDIGLVLLVFQAEVKLPKVLTFSDEHQEYMWLNDKKDLPEVINEGVSELLKNFLVA